MQVRKITLLAAVGAVATTAALSSCGDPTALEARFENRVTTAIVFALNGSPTPLPSGILLRSRQPVRVDAQFAFDIAFDINAANEVVVYTQRKVANQLVAGHPVGLQLTDDSFDEITSAPVAGYKYDSLVVLPGNKVLLVDNIDATCGQLEILGPNIRAKVRVDSVALTERAIFVTYLVNQNCGFRGLSPGLPPS